MFPQLVLCWRNGLWSPFGIENLEIDLLFSVLVNGEMACGARLGLKPHRNGSSSPDRRGRNGLWSPFGIETITCNICHTLENNGEMACGARLGLKLSVICEFVQLLDRRNGLWSAFGIETLFNRNTGRLL